MIFFSLREPFFTGRPRRTAGVASQGYSAYEYNYSQGGDFIGSDFFYFPQSGTPYVGATTFVLNAIYGAATITNFNSDETVELSSAEFSQLSSASQNGADQAVVRR